VSDVTGLDNCTCKRILDLLEESSLRIGETVVKRITVERSRRQRHDTFCGPIAFMR